jgi:hypothetical protein
VSEADPTPINDKLIDINTTYDTFWTLSAPLNTKGMQLIEDGGFAANSPDGSYCSFDPARVQTLADILKPIYEKDGTEIAPDLTAVYTNDFCADAPGR